MNIRKHWKKLLLTTTALFWASCTSENDNTLPTIAQDTSSAVDPSASSDSKIKSFSENAAESNSSDAIASSSSEAKVPSSSSAAQSSSSRIISRHYKLAGDTTVACALQFRNGKCLYPIEITLEELKDSLENNKTLPLSELEYFEDELEEYNLEDDLGPTTMYGPLPYFIDQDYCLEYEKIPYFDCSNNEIYSSETHVRDKRFIYTKEEYEKKFPEKIKSSSSSLSSSSAIPSPLCQKSDFIRCTDAIDSLIKQKDYLINNIKAEKGDSLSDNKSNCLKRLQVNFPSNCTGYLALKQTCDGETIVNPRYQGILDDNEKIVKRNIDYCLKESEK